MKNIGGIDPGKYGGIIVISPAGEILRRWTIPLIGDEVDLKSLAAIFFELSRASDHVVLEKVNAMPGQGVVSMFSFGKTFGTIEGMLAAFRIPYTLVSPRTWTKLMHTGTSPDLESKERSAIVASRIFPGLDFRASERSKKPHMGLVDAALLAEYGRRTWGQINAG